MKGGNMTPRCSELSVLVILWQVAPSAPAVPPAGAVAPDAEVPGPVEILLGNGKGGPEDRVAPRVRHHAAAPVEGRFHGLVVAAVAVVALVRRLELPDLPLLGAGLLD